MKIKSCILLVMLFAFIGCNQSGNNSTGDEKEMPSSAEDETSTSAKTKVASAVVALNNAIIDPQESVLDSIAAEELTYGHSGGLVQNKEEFIDDLINGDFDFSSVNGEDQEIFISGETAIVRQIFVAEATKLGEPVHIRIGNILVYQKQDDQWKLLARQAFRL